MTRTSAGAVSGAVSGVVSEDVVGSPLLVSGERVESALQAAVRGGPRAHEDWSVQTLTEVCLQRVAEAGCRGAASVEDTRGNRLLVVSDPAGHRLAAAMLYALSCDNWIEAGARRNRHLRSIDPVRERLRMLNDVVENLAVKPHYIQTLAALFAEPYDDTWLAHVRLDCALGLWWEARLSDGHSPESADTLLALLVHPTVAARFAYRRTDDCPRLG